MVFIFFWKYTYSRKSAENYFPTSGLATGLRVNYRYSRGALSPDPWNSRSSAFLIQRWCLMNQGGRKPSFLGRLGGPPSECLSPQLRITKPHPPSPTPLWNEKPAHGLCKSLLCVYVTQINKKTVLPPTELHFRRSLHLNMDLLWVRILHGAIFYSVALAKQGLGRRGQIGVISNTLG